MYESKINLAIIGAGRWGFNHIRTAAQTLPPENILVCDFNPETEKKVKELNPEIRFTTDVDDILENGGINAVIVATPAETHYSIASKILLKGKNVLVEKPITLKSDDAAHLLAIAEENKAKLMVGHILLYHPAFQKLKKEVDKGKIGDIQYIYSNRLNLGALRSEENALWSFAPHDISMIQELTGSYPDEINAHGAHFVQEKVEDTTLTYLHYPSNVHAHVYVSWLHPFKEQRLVVIGSKGMMVFEDSKKTNKLLFYPKGFAKAGNGAIEKFDSEPEPLEFEEGKSPLTEEQKHFFECIIHDKKPVTDGEHALKVLKILEKATEDIIHHNSLALKGEV